MAELSVVRRYARALFDTAKRAGTVDQVEEDLHGIHELLGSVPRLERTLRAPTVSAQSKKTLLQRAFQGRVSDLTLRFLNLVLDRRREEILSAVYTEFHRLANDWRNIVVVEVTAAT